MATAAILPVKRFDLAKQRLGAGVGDLLRNDLARAMVGDVLQALHESPSIDRTIVITGEPAVAEAASLQGAIVVDDDRQEGQSAAVSLGLERAANEGFQRALCIPGDCPALDPVEIAEILARSITEPSLLVVPDRHGTGTNALLLAPIGVIKPSFGPGSCARHLELARAADANCDVVSLSSLLLDIDTREDLDVLRERLSSEQSRAPRTRAVLDLTTTS
jgi:2-phospho-L-lactate guanylyltransferase